MAKAKEPVNIRETQMITSNEVGKMPGELVQKDGGPLIDVSQFGLAKYVTEETFNEFSKSTFLSRLQLFGAGSDLVKEGKIPMASYAIVDGKDDVRIILGTSVDVIPLALRLIAMRFGESFAAYYNPEMPEFKQIVVDSEDPTPQCMYGPQFLVWIPAAQDFCTFLFGSKTSRKEARNMRPLMGRAATLKSKLIKANYSWHVPIVIPSSTQNLVTPDPARVKAMIEQFNNPEESQEFNTEQLEADSKEASKSQTPQGRAR